MYLKKLSLVVILALTAGCDEIEPDKVLIDQLWTKTIAVVGIDPETSKPEIALLEKDLYQEIYQLNCESKSGKSNESCLAVRKDLEDSVLAKTGKNYQSRYEGYIKSERNFLDEDCEKYSDKGKKEQCKADKPSKKTGNMVLGRAFLADDYIEIYYSNIYKSTWNNLDHALVGNAKKESYFYSVIAHEMLHVALFKKNVDVNEHHRLMRDKHMDPMINFISDYKETDRDGFHRKLAFGSLEVGIAGDETLKRINERKNPKESSFKIYKLPPHCELNIR